METIIVAAVMKGLQESITTCPLPRTSKFRTWWLNCSALLRLGFALNPMLPRDPRRNPYSLLDDFQQDREAHYFKRPGRNVRGLGFRVLNSWSNEDFRSRRRQHSIGLRSMHAKRTALMQFFQNHNSSRRLTP